MWTQRLAAVFRSASIAKYRWRVWRESFRRNWKSPKIGYVCCIEKSKYCVNFLHHLFLIACSFCLSLLARVCNALCTRHAHLQFQSKIKTKGFGASYCQRSRRLTYYIWGKMKFWCKRRDGEREREIKTFTIVERSVFHTHTLTRTHTQKHAACVLAGESCEKKIILDCGLFAKPPAHAQLCVFLRFSNKFNASTVPDEHKTNDKCRTAYDFIYSLIWICPSIYSDLDTFNSNERKCTWSSVSGEQSNARNAILCVWFDGVFFSVRISAEITHSRCTNAAILFFHWIDGVSCNDCV